MYLPYTPMLSTGLRTIATHALCEPGDRVIVAVSGGPDSMALLHVLWEARDRLGLTLEVAGVDHGLRPAAGEELALVRARAQALGLPFVSLSVDVARHRRGGGLQDAARRARLGALAELATAHGARRVALGHQADNQAETVLFRIVRGTGLAGYRGCPYRRDPHHPSLARPVARGDSPLPATADIPFVEDPSNADLRFARARIRHRHLPALAEENPRVVEALVALAAAARDARPARRGTVTTLRTPRTVMPARRPSPRPRCRAGWRRWSSACERAGGRRRSTSAGGRVEVFRRRRAPGGAGAGANAPVAERTAPGRLAWDLPLGTRHAGAQGTRQATPEPGRRPPGRIRRRLAEWPLTARARSRAHPHATAGWKEGAASSPT